MCSNNLCIMEKAIDEWLKFCFCNWMIYQATDSAELRLRMTLK